MNKIRKGDQVVVLTGRDKGKRGTVALRKDDSYLLVDPGYPQDMAKSPSFTPLMETGRKYLGFNGTLSGV